MKHSIDDAAPFRTLDGSEIRELLHPQHGGPQNQSLAEARVPPGATTLAHHHVRSEEIYHILAGTGLMRLGEQEFAVAPGDSVLIPPGMRHCIHNSGTTTLRFLCCCSPAYSHQDTVLEE